MGNWERRGIWKSNREVHDQRCTLCQLMEIEDPFLPQWDSHDQLVMLVMWGIWHCLLMTVRTLLLQLRLIRGISSMILFFFFEKGYQTWFWMGQKGSSGFICGKEEQRGRTLEETEAFDKSREVSFLNKQWWMPVSRTSLGRLRCHGIRLTSHKNSVACSKILCQVGHNLFWFSFLHYKIYIFHVKYWCLIYTMTIFFIFD